MYNLYFCISILIKSSAPEYCTIGYQWYINSWAILPYIRVSGITSTAKIHLGVFMKPALFHLLAALSNLYMELETFQSVHDPEDPPYYYKL